MGRATALSALAFGTGLCLLPAFPCVADAPAADHLRLRLVKIMDASGFGQPMEAASLLLPSDWKVESGVSWTTDLGCPQNVMQLRLKASSPDGRLGFEVFPDFSWWWYDDPAVQQYARQAEQIYGIRGCELLPPFDAPSYLEQVFLPRWRAGSTLVDLGRVEGLAETMRLQLQAAAGWTQGVVQNDFDAALATLETPRADGTDSEWVLASVLHTTTPLPMMSSLWTGTLQTAASYKSAAISQFAARAPKGELERHERLFEVIYRSFRLDPRWDAARLQFWQAIDQIEHKGIQDRLRVLADGVNRRGSSLNVVAHGWGAYLSIAALHTQPRANITAVNPYPGPWRAAEFRQALRDSRSAVTLVVGQFDVIASLGDGGGSVSAESPSCLPAVAESANVPFDASRSPALSRALE